jgi:hypothetical protein
MRARMRVRPDARRATTSTHPILVSARIVTRALPTSHVFSATLGGLVVRTRVHENVTEHRVGRPRIRAGVRVPCEPIEAHFCRLVDLVLATVGQEQLSRDVLDVFGAVWQLQSQEPQIDDVVRHDAKVLRERPRRVGRLLGAVV